MTHENVEYIVIIFQDISKKKIKIYNYRGILSDQIRKSE